MNPLPPGCFCYIAAPISNRYRVVEWDRMRQASTFAACLARHGVAVFCPAAHSTGLLAAASLTDPPMRLPRSWAFWRRHDLPILRAASILAVLCLPGWRSSRGVKAEIKEARRLHIPIVYISLKGGKLKCR